MKISHFLLCFSFAATLVITGCEPMMFGMPANQFKSLTPQQQDQVISAYNQREQVKTQNQPYEDIIHAVVPAIHAAKEKPYQSDQSPQQPNFNTLPSPPPMPVMPSMPTMPNHL